MISRKLVIPIITEEEGQIYIALLSQFDLDAILETDNSIEVYKENEEYSDCISYLVDYTKISADALKIVEVEKQNWNKKWESNFDPIHIGNLTVRATFHAPSDNSSEEIVIAPKMAFGTGHHETTHMMLESMKEMNLSNQSVLDYGCGTGILAIYAMIRKADHVTAIDIQEEAVENTQEHFHLNNLSLDQTTILQGDLVKVKESSFDCILANINRHVLIDNCKELRKLLAEKGKLLMSGILISDKELVSSIYTDAGFTLLDTKEKGEWSMMTFQ